MHVQQEYLSHTSKPGQRKTCNATTMKHTRPGPRHDEFAPRDGHGSSNLFLKPAWVLISVRHRRCSLVSTRWKLEQIENAPVRPPGSGDWAAPHVHDASHQNEPCSTAPPRAVASREGAACNRSAERTDWSRSLQRIDGPVERPPLLLAARPIARPILIGPAAPVGPRGAQRQPHACVEYLDIWRRRLVRGKVRVGAGQMPADLSG